MLLFTKNIIKILLINLLMLNCMQLYASSYLKCKKVSGKSNNDKMMIFFDKGYITVMDDIYTINLNFIDSLLDEKENYFDLYEKKENNFSYSIKIYNNNIVHLSGKSELDNIDIKKEVFTCKSYF